MNCLFTRIIVVHPDRITPGVTTIGRFCQPYIGILFSVPLIGPVEVEVPLFGPPLVSHFKIGNPLQQEQSRDGIIPSTGKLADDDILIQPGIAFIV